MRVVVVQQSILDVETISGDNGNREAIVDELVATISEAQVSSVRIHVEVARSWATVSHTQLVGLETA